LQRGAIIAVVIFALEPSVLQRRSGLGGFDHFAGYLVITAIFCLVWPRPFVVREAFMAMLEEAMMPWFRPARVE
jgi:hypothetical protein